MENNTEQTWIYGLGVLDLFIVPKGESRMKTILENTVARIFQN